MAITFESIKDPYGLGSAGQAIGNASMQRSLMDLQQQKTREEEDRQRGIQQKAYSTLGKTLEEFSPKQPGEIWDDNRTSAFMAKALESGASMTDIMNLIKGMQTQKKSPNVAQTPFTKELAKKNVNLLNKYTDHGRKAKEMLGSVDALQGAVTDPERWDNIAARALKMMPGADLGYGSSDQIMSNFSKEFVTNFSGIEGLRLTDAKLKWIAGVPPSPYKSREANITSLANVERLLQIQDAYGNVARGIANSYLEAGLDVPPNFEKLVEDAIEPLRQEFDDIYNESIKKQKESKPSQDLGETFKKMPDPKEYEGAEITDSKGNKYVSTGTKWRKVK
jgi:hypothetical protein